MQAKQAYLIFFLLLDFPWATASSAKDKQLIEKENDGAFVYDFKLSFGGFYNSALYFGEDSNEVAPFVLVSLDMEYKGFFHESSSKNRLSTLLGRETTGYHLWETEQQQLDIIIADYTLAIDTTDSNDNDIPELRQLNKRKNSLDMGVRYSRFVDDWYFSTEIVSDLFRSAHDGFLVDTYIGQLITKGNWDLTYAIGHIWYSSKTTNYYLGLKEEEIVNQWSPYKTTTGYIFDLTFSAQYPLSESWVFESAISYTWFSKNITNSPLIVDDSNLFAFFGFSYVF